MMCPGLAVGWVQAASMAARLWANAATWWHPAHNGSGAQRAAVGAVSIPSRGEWPLI